jgi:hypothetical protein
MSSPSNVRAIPSQRPVIAHCMPIGSSIDPGNFSSYRYLRRDFLGAKGWYHLEEVGKPVQVARNVLTANALSIRVCKECGQPQEKPLLRCPQCGCFDSLPAVTHLFWTDDDMVYPPESLKSLLERDLDFVGGLCHNRRHPYNPVIARNYHPSWGFEKGTYGWLFDFPKETLLEVDATGGAFLLIKREVFENIRQRECELMVEAGVELGKYSASSDEAKADLKKLLSEWGDWWTPGENEGLSEDLSLCRRAKNAGHRIFVDTGLDIGHVGKVVIDTAFARRNRQFEYSQWMAAPGQVLVENEAMRPAEPNPEKPVATIVITSYNSRPEFLYAAVQSAMMQSVPVEVIVVDDGSEPAILKDADQWASTSGEKVAPDGSNLFRGPSTFRVIRHEKNQGIAAALNTGIEAMTTDWFCWLPSDDLFVPLKVEMQLSALLATGRRCGFHGYTLKTDNSNRVGFIGITMWPTMEDQQSILASGCAINGTTVMIHREVFKQVGVFDTSFKYGQDWEFWNRVGREYFWHSMPDRLAIRREGGNLTERIAKDDKLRERRDSEDARIHRMYAVRLCPCCGEVLP